MATLSLAPPAGAPGKLPTVKIGTIILLTLADGTSRFCSRLIDGLAVVCAPAPETIPIQDTDAVLAWMASVPQVWYLLAELSKSSAFAMWWPGQGQPEGIEEDDLVRMINEDGTLADVAQSTIAIGMQMFDAWADFPMDVKVDVRMQTLWAPAETPEA